MKAPKLPMIARFALSSSSAGTGSLRSDSAQYINSFIAPSVTSVLTSELSHVPLNFEPPKLLYARRCTLVLAQVHDTLLMDPRRERVSQQHCKVVRMVRSMPSVPSGKTVCTDWRSNQDKIRDFRLLGRRGIVVAGHPLLPIAEIFRASA